MIVARTRSLKLTLATLCGLLLALPASAAAIAPAEQFGMTGGGAGAGQIGLGAEGAAVGDGGNLFVADPANHRIDVFAADGSFTEAFGWGVATGGPPGFQTCTFSCRAGTAGGGAGQLSDPQGMAIAGDGNLYVADPENDRIDVFSQSATFVRAFGWDVSPGGGTGFEFCTTACKRGDAGGSAGQLDDPVDLTVGASGDLLVAERGCVGGGCPPGPSGNRLSVFNQYDEFLRAFGADVVPGGSPGFEVCTAQTGCQDGTASTAAGGLSHPRSVAISASGELYVTEPSVNRVSAFGTSEPTFLGAFGKDVVPGGNTGYEVCSASSGCKAGLAGAAAGEMSGPAGVLSTDGQIYVADSVNQRVDRFGSSGEFVDAFGRGVAGGAPSFEVCTAFCQAGTTGTGGGEFSLPTGVAVDCRGAIYVTDSGNGRVQKFATGDLRPPPCPSNFFSFRKTKLNRRTGSARLTVAVASPGSVTGKGHGVKRRTVQSVTGRNVILRIKPKGGLRRRLRHQHKAAVADKVTFTPYNGDPNTKVKRLTLRKPQRH